MKACILGAGVVGGFGCGRAALEAVIRNRFAAEAPAVPALPAQTDLLDRFVPPRTLRRVDHYARMALLASCLALEDAGMDDGLPENTGLIVATALTLLVAAAVSAGAQETRVQVTPIPCLPLEGDTPVNVTLAPDSAGAEVRVYFRRLSIEVEDFYYVEMEPTGQGQYWGVFPIPTEAKIERKDLKKSDTPPPLVPAVLTTVAVYSGSRARKTVFSRRSSRSNFPKRSTNSKSCLSVIFFPLFS